MIKLKKAAAVICTLSLLLGAGASAAEPSIPTAEPGKRTVKNFLATAIQPIGSALYVWGGAWSEDDSSSGIEAVSIGLGGRWKQFYDLHGADYNYESYNYQIHDGLDCSGFVGWAVYNTLNDSNGKQGYVMRSTVMAKNFANRGWGTFTSRAGISRLHAGDVMSTSGHVYIGIGECIDGSRVLLHSSPPCVQITGTGTMDYLDEEKLRKQSNDETPIEYDSEAVRLADYYMNKYWPQLHAKFPRHSRGTSYLTDYDQFSWYNFGSILSDPDGYQSMNPYYVLKDLFNDDGVILEKAKNKISIDGIELQNEGGKYPVLDYNGVMYYPLTFEDSLRLGFMPQWSVETGLILTKTGQRTEAAPPQGREPLLIGEPSEGVLLGESKITASQEYPIVKCGGVEYLPLTWDIMQQLGIGAEFSGNMLSLTSAMPDETEKGAQISETEI